MGMEWKKDGRGGFIEKRGRGKFGREMEEREERECTITIRGEV